MTHHELHRRLQRHQDARRESADRRQRLWQPADDLNVRDGDQSGRVAEPVQPQFRQSENRNDQRGERSDAQKHWHDNAHSHRPEHQRKFRVCYWN